LPSTHLPLSTKGAAAATGVAAAGAALPVAAGVALLVAAGAAVVAALAGAALLGAAGVAAVLLATGAAGGTLLLVSLSWLQAASASRAAHRNGRRFNMADLERWGMEPTAPTRRSA
jgi:hypothetical protein